MSAQRNTTDYILEVCTGIFNRQTREIARSEEMEKAIAGIQDDMRDINTRVSRLEGRLNGTKSGDYGVLTDLFRNSSTFFKVFMATVISLGVLGTALIILLRGFR
jgi:hypothetical protein